MRCIKIFICTLLMLSLFGCGKKSETTSIDKDGIKYEISNISFYYPKDYKLEMNTTNDSDPTTLNFKLDDQLLYYTVEDAKFDNETEDMKELYTGELEEVGASSIKVKEPVLDSGLTCYEFSGKFKDTGIKFTNLVYFENNKSYIYGYQAKSDTYDDNIDSIVVYLESFYKASGKVED